MSAIMTHPEGAPDQIGHSLRGPDGRRETISLGPRGEQPRRLEQLSARQLGGPSGTRAAAQAGFPSSPQLPSPHKDRLATHAQLPGGGSKRLAALQPEKGGRPPRLHRARLVEGE